MQKKYYIYIYIEYKYTDINTQYWTKSMLKENQLVIPDVKYLF